jgi:hypothetical protein
MAFTFAVIVANGRDPFSHKAGDGHGEVAVDVEAFAPVVRVQWRFGGAQVEERVVGCLQLVGNNGQEAFVGVEVVLLVPIEAGKAEVGA